jgi:hypothetical protein
MNAIPVPSSATTIAGAQRDMRDAYYGGALGMLTSAAVWLAASLVSVLYSSERAVWALFVGGMFIHPVSVLLTRALGRSGRHGRDNPFGPMALAGTFWMIMCLPLAYAVSVLRIDWFFPAMLLVIGGRYLTFTTMFGLRIYWLCGGALAVAAYVLVLLRASPALGAAAGAAIEALFAIAIVLASRREYRAGM